MSSEPNSFSSLPRLTPDATPARSGGVPGEPSTSPVTASLGLSGLPGDATAVLVSLGRTEYLGRTLEALAAQSRPPARVLMVDVSRDSELSLPPGAPSSWHLLAAPGARTFGAAVRAALAADAASQAAAPTKWLWLLHDDSAPEPSALAALLRAVEHSPSVAVAGSKQRTWSEPVRLLEAGVTTSRFGRRMTGVAEGEVDQGQLDGRDDVLGVGTAGMLVRADVWAELGGTDPALGPYLDGLDLSRRARLAGHRVVVVPEAVVRHARASFAGVRDGEEPDHRRSFGARRQALLHTQLAWVPLPLVPVVLALALASGVARALWRVVTKEPVLALADLTAPLRVLSRPDRIIAARRSARRSRRLPRRSLRLLQASWRDVYREYRDRRMRRRESQRVVRAPSELELRELASVTRRRRWALAGLALVLAGLSALGTSGLLAGVLSGARLAGGALAPSAPFASWWDAVTSGWVAGGLGAPGPADPLLLALAPLAAVSDGRAEPFVMLGAVLVAGLSAWFAAGAATRSLSLRAWAGLVWASAPALLVAQGQGRLGAVLAHLMIPWVALGIARAVGVQRTDVIASGLVDADRKHLEGPAAPEPGLPRAEAPGLEASETEAADLPAAPEDAVDPDAERWRGSLGAAAAAGLAFAVASAGAPALLPAGLLVLLVIALVVPRRRGRVLFVAVPALVLHAPVLAEAIGGSRAAVAALLADPGLPLASSPAPVWQQALGWPVEPAGGSSILPELPFEAWAWFSGAVLVLVALSALFRGREVARGVRAGWWTLASGLLVAGVASRVEVSAGEETLVRGWSGAGVSLALAGLLLAALLGADGARDRLGARTFGWRQPLVALLALLAAAGPLAVLGSWALDARAGRDGLVGERELAALERPLVPAVARQAQHGGQSARVLALAPQSVEGGGEGVRWQLLREDGPALTDRSAIVAAREVYPEELVSLGPGPDADAEDQAQQGAVPVEGALGGGEAVVEVDELVARIVAGSAGDVSEALAERAVAIVLLPPVDEDAPVALRSARGRLEGQLDATEGLERIAANETGTVWRVAVVDGETEVVGGSAWAQVVDAEGRRRAVASQGLRIDTEIEAGPPGRTLVLAETAHAGWRARLDGQALRAVEDDWRVAFELPAQGGTLEVSYDPADREPLLWLQGVVLGLTVLLALPVRRRRGVVQ